MGIIASSRENENLYKQDTFFLVYGTLDYLAIIYLVIKCDFIV